MIRILLLVAIVYRPGARSTQPLRIALIEKSEGSHNLLILIKDWLVALILQLALLRALLVIRCGRGITAF